MTWQLFWWLMIITFISNMPKFIYSSVSVGRISFCYWYTVRVKCACLGIWLLIGQKYIYFILHHTGTVSAALRNKKRANQHLDNNLCVCPYEVAQNVLGLFLVHYGHASQQHNAHRHRPVSSSPLLERPSYCLRTVENLFPPRSSTSGSDWLPVKLLVSERQSARKPYNVTQDTLQKERNKLFHYTR